VHYCRDSSVRGHWELMVSQCPQTSSNGSGDFIETNKRKQKTPSFKVWVQNPFIIRCIGVIFNNQQHPTKPREVY